MRWWIIEGVPKTAYFKKPRVKYFLAISVSVGNASKPDLNLESMVLLLSPNDTKHVWSGGSGTCVAYGISLERFAVEKSVFEKWMYQEHSLISDDNTRSIRISTMSDLYKSYDVYVTFEWNLFLQYPNTFF